MASSVRFACTSLNGANKIGLIKPDENGYYPLVVGALNMFNTAGEYYQADQAKELFMGSSQLMRRVKRGALRGEYGHPKPQPGQSEKSFAARCLDIDVDRACCHHKDLTLDFDNVKDKNGQVVIAIISKVCPSGPFGPILEKSLKNKDENVCFSIRSFTEDRMIRGVNHRIIRNVVTFDYVNEPGMAVAEKFLSPALEGLSDMTFSRSMLEDGLRETQRSGIATESASLNASELFSTMGWNIRTDDTPAWAKW